MSNNFKLIAVRILPDCAEHIRKCLSENTFYYLCNDYEITDDAETIREKSKYCKPLNENFFKLSDYSNDNDNLTINLSAIVGMNGDGKSTLIEVIIRLLNNFAYHHGFGKEGTLTIVKGLKAELYYKLDDYFYKIKEETEIDLYKYNINKLGVYVIDKKKLEAVNSIFLSTNFFYTMVTNYSLYAYNTLEFEKEWNDWKTSNNEDECWLHRVFHKNDGYQTPISLHPYREYGSIDIEREKDLSLQRLLSAFSQISYKELNSKDQVKNTNSFLETNGKKVEAIKLEDVGYSKLQKVTISDFFRKNEKKNLLKEEIELTIIKPLQWNENEINDDKHNENVEKIFDNLQLMYMSYINHSNNKKLFDSAIEYAIKNNLLSDESDIDTLLHNLENIVNEQWGDKHNYDYEKIINEWRPYRKFNLCQLQRIELIDNICDIWRHEGLRLNNHEWIKIDLEPTIVFKKYEELTNVEKCLHYIIYKTIAIFETYASYGLPCIDYKTFNILKIFRQPIVYENGEYKFFSSSPNKKMKIAFDKLTEDWKQKSHITLKLRQAYNYYKEINSSSDIYNDESIKENYSKLGECISLTKLAERHGSKMLDLENLPPAIFKWNIYFKTNAGEMVSFETLSSGEKQRYFSTGAILYHLLNIDSISSTEKTHYSAINLIFEEIELYFHPDWQRQFSDFLMKSIHQFNFKHIKSINILYVTHSPYILSDIPKTNVLFLKDGKPSYNMQENTFGANINSLLKNGFFMPGLPIGEFAHKKIDGMFAKLHSGDFNKDEMESLRQDILLVGEPFIRQQLMTLYNTYTEFNKDAISQMIVDYFKRKKDND